MSNKHEAVSKILADRAGLEIVKSPFSTFNKDNEFVVLKGIVFKIQSISPKKIILKQYTVSVDDLADGVYCFRNKRMELKNVRS